MAAPLETTGLVYEDLARFPNDNLRRELLDGELVVTPAPSVRHQEVVAWLTAELVAHVREHGGRALPAPTDVLFADDTVCEPDVVYVSQERLDRLTQKFIRSAPDLVVEVSSPSTRRLELVRKREVYDRFGVPEYWYVDLDAERVEVYALGDTGYGPPRLLLPGDRLTTSLLPGLDLAVAELLHPWD